MDEQRTRKREADKRLRETREELGLCTRCGKKKAAPGRKSCPECLEKARANTKRWANKNPGYGQVRRERLREKGICTKCGKEMVAGGRSYCRNCLLRAKKKKIMKELKENADNGR